MIAWMHLLVSLVGGGILLGLGLTKARARSAAAGWLFAAAGALIPLSACCVSVTILADEALPDPGAMIQMASVLSSMGDLVGMILVAAGFLVLSRARTAATPGAVTGA